MEEGKKKERLTREDVLRLIEEHGGTAQGLDLSGARFKEGIDLRRIDLSGIILERATLSFAHLEVASLREAHLKAADLVAAHLERAFLHGAHLERAHLDGARLEGADLGEAHLEGAILISVHLEGAGLVGAHLEGAELFAAHLEEASLGAAHLEGARLWGAAFSQDTIFEGAGWGSKYILGEEVYKDFGLATQVYRTLKQWHTQAGMYDIAGEFYYREMETRRKFAQGQIHEEFKKSKGWKFLHFLFKEKDLGNSVRLWVYKLTCGYGERPIRVVGWAVAVVLGMGAIYSASALTFPSSFYYSAVSFTALGYGLWVPNPEGWVKALGAFEAFIGVFMIALFLVTFTRKMIR